MAKKVLIALAEGFEEIEAVTCFDVFRRGGLDVTLAGINAKAIKGSRGLLVQADRLINDAGKDYDAIVLPGGMPGATNLAHSQELNALLYSFNKEGKLIAAICASPAVVLAPSGILKGRKATCFPGMQEDFPPDIEYSSDKLVEDANIITSQGPATAMGFALAVLKKLAGKEIRDKAAKALLQEG